MNKRGFTLIELTVVVTIIGMLASIVLASLGDSKNKAGDAAIHTEIKNTITQAELFVENHGNYFGFCSASDGFKPFGDSALKSGSTKISCLSTTDDTGWAAEATLKSDSSTYYCVDSKNHELTRSQALFVPDCTVPLPS